MAYQIEKKDGFFEVNVSGETSKFEIIKILLELAFRNPEKKLPDLWAFSEASEVPFRQFSDIVQVIQHLLPRDAAGNKTAIVAADAIQGGILELFRAEASSLPYEIGVFRSRDEAIEWFKSPKPPAAPRWRR